jgi:hypothetical protein
VETVDAGGRFTELVVVTERVVLPRELELADVVTEEIEAVTLVNEELAEDEEELAVGAPEVENSSALLKPLSATHRFPEEPNVIPSGVQRSDCVAVIERF